MLEGGIIAKLLDEKWTTYAKVGWIHHEYSVWMGSHLLGEVVEIYLQSKWNFTFAGILHETSLYLVASLTHNVNGRLSATKHKGALTDFVLMSLRRAPTSALICFVSPTSYTHCSNQNVILFSAYILRNVHMIRTEHLIIQQHSLLRGIKSESGEITTEDISRYCFEVYIRFLVHSSYIAQSCRLCHQNDFNLLRRLLHSWAALVSSSSS